MSGYTLLYHPYSPGLVRFQVAGGCSSVKVIRAMNLADLKPYFQGSVIRKGMPFCGNWWSP